MAGHRAAPNTPLHPTSRIAVLAMAIGGLLALGGCPRKETPVAANDAPAAVTAPAAAPSPVAPPTASATLKRAELMALAFPASQGPNAKQGEPDIVLLPEMGNDGKAVPGSEAEQKAQVSPREVVRLDETHAVMLTEAVPVDDSGQPMNGHPDGAWLGAYSFEQGAEGWKLTGRSDAVDYLGFMGFMGNTKVERITPRRFALTITNGSCWQGYCGRWLSVYGLETGKVRPLASAIPLSATNEGADEACGKVLKSQKPDSQPQHECYDISGTPRFVAAGAEDSTPGELRIAFKGARTASAKARRVDTIDTTLVYAYRNDAYVVTEGRNPVPSF